MADWPYNTRLWQSLRKRKLADKQWCEPCDRRGIRTPANTVDHIKRVKDGGNPFPPLAGLMSMCASCHNSKTMRGDMRGTFGLKGAGLDGMPIDAAHPFLTGHTPSRDGQLRAVDRHGYRKSTKFRRV